MTQMDLRSRLEVNNKSLGWCEIVSEYINQSRSRATASQIRNLVDSNYPSVIGMIKAVRAFEEDNTLIE
jgi:hypothetical protein